VSAETSIMNGSLNLKYLSHGNPTFTGNVLSGIDSGGRLSRVAPLADLSSSSTRTHIERSQSSQSARDPVMGF
jgi:hypothetical protein